MQELYATAQQSVKWTLMVWPENIEGSVAADVRRLAGKKRERNWRTELKGESPQPATSRPLLRGRKLATLELELSNSNS